MTILLRRRDDWMPFSASSFLRAVGREMATRGISVAADGVRLEPGEVKDVCAVLARDIDLGSSAHG